MVEMADNSGEVQRVSARVWATIQDRYGVEVGGTYRAKKQLYIAKNGELRVDITVSHLTSLGAPIPKPEDFFSAEEIAAHLAASDANSKPDFEG
jgi:hypothetical protein